MTVEALLPAIHQASGDEVLDLDEEVFDFLGDFVDAPVDTIAPFPTVQIPTTAPGHSVSPAVSVSGDESSTTSEDHIQANHVKVQKSATVAGKAMPIKSTKEKKDRRRERNRAHAKACRLRKKNHQLLIEAENMQLKKQMESLKGLMLTRFSHDEIARLLSSVSTPVPPQPDNAPSHFSQC